MRNNKCQDDNYGIPKQVLNARIEQIKAENRKKEQDDMHPIWYVITFILCWPLFILFFLLMGRK
jgi:hypothetical protein